MPKVVNLPPVNSIALISVVDDDESVRESLLGLLRSVGFKVNVFISAEAFLKSDQFTNTDCLILDLKMPGMGGIGLRRHLEKLGHEIPVIFISAHGDEETRKQVLTEGVVAFLIKPFNEDELLNAIQSALGAR